MVIKKVILDELGKMRVNDLIELNHLVVRMIKHKRGHEAITKSMSFKVGDKVIFSSNRVGRKEGEIVKMNRRKAVVKVESWGNHFAPIQTVKWSVPYEMLSKI